MNDMNYVLVTGKLTRDPELKMLTADSSLCQFTIAISKHYKKKGSDTYSTETSFFFVETWGDLADNCFEYLKKGRKVRVVGHIRQARWKDRNNDDRPRERTYIVAEHIEFGDLPTQTSLPAVPEEVKVGFDDAIVASKDIDESDIKEAELSESEDSEK